MLLGFGLIGKRDEQHLTLLNGATGYGSQTLPGQRCIHKIQKLSSKFKRRIMCESASGFLIG
jgi:hypothetical protein